MILEVHSSIDLTGPVLSAEMLFVPSLAHLTEHCNAGRSSCALTQMLHPMPMATVVGHLTMPCLVWTRVGWSFSLETMQP